MARIRFDEADAGCRIDRGQNRYDVAELRAPERTPEGYLRAEGRISRVGVFRYRLDDGTEIRELRPPEEVFDAESIRTFALAPLTIEHPVRNGQRVLLTAETAKEHAVGSIGEPRQVGTHLVSDILITDARAIEMVMAGTKKLSPGYTSDVWFTPGVYFDDDGNSVQFDAVQRNIRGNHMALTKRPRQGPSTEVRVDGAEEEESAPMKKKTIKIHGIEVEVDADKADALEAEAKKARPEQLPLVIGDDAIKALREENGQLRGRLDSMEAEAKKGKETDKSKAEIKRHVALVARASKALDSDPEELADLSALEIMKKVIAEKSTVAIADDAEESYVRGIFDHVTREDAEDKPKKKAVDENEDGGFTAAIRKKKERADEAEDEEDVDPVMAAYLNRAKMDSEAWQIGRNRKSGETDD